jgi:hypothetical protein
MESESSEEELGQPEAADRWQQPTNLLLPRRGTMEMKSPITGSVTFSLLKCAFFVHKWTICPP